MIAHLLIALTPPCASAPVQELVVDLQTYSPLASSHPGSFAEFQGRPVFRASDPVYGQEVFAWNGFGVELDRLSDIIPSSEGQIGDITATSTHVFFTVTHLDSWGSPSGDIELWSTDGDPSNTHRYAGIANPEFMTVLGNLMLFVPDDDTIWASDGTEAGTYPVTTPPAPPTFPHDLYAYDGYVYFSGRGLPLPNETELWRTDGTPGGAELVADLVPVSSSPPEEFAEIGGWLWFETWQGIHRTDGTTVELVASEPKNARTFVESDGYAVFVARSFVGADTWALWRSDGTEQGTISIDILTGDPPYQPRLVSIGSKVIVAVRVTSSINALLALDTAAGTTTILNFGDQVDEMVGLDGEALIERNYLWRTDGTPAGTIELVDFRAIELGALGDGTFWVNGRTNGDEIGYEPYRAVVDGPLELAQDVAPPGSDGGHYSSLARTTDGSVYFEEFSDVYRTDGTPEGTLWIAEGREPVAVGERVYYRTLGTFSSSGIWTTDGTSPATSVGPVSGTYGPMIGLGDALYYELTPSGGTTEIYRTYGVPGDAVPVASAFDVDVMLGGFDEHLFYLSRDTSWPYPASLYHVNVETGATELLFTDVDEDDLSEIERIGEDRALFLLGGELNLLELDAADAVMTIIAVVENFNRRGTASPANIGHGVLFGELNGDLNHLWFSDGTPGGTYEVSASVGVLSPISVVDGIGYFLGRGLGDFGLWRSDGSFAGTYRIGDEFTFFPFEGGGSTLSAGDIAEFDERTVRLIGSDGTMVFRGNHWSTGNELWISDGTHAGTHALSDGWPGSGSADPLDVTRAGGRVVMTAVDPLYGRELHAIDFEALGSFVSETYGGGCAGAGDPPRITTQGEPIAGQPFVLHAENAVPGELALLFYSPTAAHIPLDAECTVYLAPPWILHSVSVVGAGGTGGPTLNFPPSPTLYGLPLRWQFAVTDPVPTEYGGNLTGAIETIVGS